MGFIKSIAIKKVTKTISGVIRDVAKTPKVADGRVEYDSSLPPAGEILPVAMKTINGKGAIYGTPTDLRRTITSCMDGEVPPIDRSLAELIDDRTRRGFSALPPEVKKALYGLNWAGLHAAIITNTTILSPFTPPSGEELVLAWFVDTRLYNYLNKAAVFVHACVRGWDEKGWDGTPWNHMESVRRTNATNQLRVLKNPKKYLKGFLELKFTECPPAKELPGLFPGDYKTLKRALEATLKGGTK